MRLEDSPEYIDMVAQAVVDKMEETRRLSTVVEQVARRVLEMQEEIKQAASEGAGHQGTSPVQDTDTHEENEEDHDA